MYIIYTEYCIDKQPVRVYYASTPIFESAADLVIDLNHSTASNNFCYKICKIDDIKLLAITGAPMRL